jgi:hypothetical protein
MATPRPRRHDLNLRLRRAVRLVPALAAALLLPSCGEDTGTLPDVATAVVQLTVDPNPVTGLQNNLTGSVTASYKITLQEFAGLGANVEFVSSAVYEPTSGALLILNYYDAADLKVFVGSDRLEPKGTLDIAHSVTYTLSDLTKATNISVTAQIRDDRDNLHYKTLLVPVQ